MRAIGGPLLAFLFSFLFLCHSQELISRTVAEINNDFLTSREVVLSALISSCMDGNCDRLNLTTVKIKTDTFATLLSKTIFERLAYLESKGIFKSKKTMPAKLLAQVLQAAPTKKYRFSANEIKKIYSLKMLAKDYVSFKDKNLSVYITDSEALNEFKVNASKYKNKTFADVKKKIKSELVQVRKRKRVEDWVTSMQLKYRVRQIIN